VDDFSLLVRATLALYRDALRDASRALLQNLWVIFLVPTYSILLGLASVSVGGLGFVGGFLVYLVLAACSSSFLAVIAELVEHQRVRPSELASTFGRYLSSLISVFFIFWIIQLLLTLIAQQNEAMVWLDLAVNVGLFVVCNPLPELIYQSSRDGLVLVDEAVQFVRENAIEWLLPVAICLVPFFAIGMSFGFAAMAQLGPSSALQFVMRSLAPWMPQTSSVSSFLLPLIASALLVWVMLFRGFLFHALNRSNRRQRIFDARMRG
jgi:hypothetical protein